MTANLFYNGPQLTYVDLSMPNSTSIVEYFRDVAKSSVAFLHLSVGCNDEVSIGVRVRLCLSQIDAEPSGVGICVRPLFVDKVDDNDSGGDPRAIIGEWLRFYVDQQVKSLFLHARSEKLLRELNDIVQPFRGKLRHLELALAPANFTANQRIGNLADTIDQVLLFNRCIMRANSLGIKWLALIDFDEFFVFQSNIESSSDALRRSAEPSRTMVTFLERLPSDTASVLVEMYQCVVRPAPRHKNIVRPQFVERVDVHNTAQLVNPNSSSILVSMFHRSQHELSMHSFHVEMHAKQLHRLLYDYVLLHLRILHRRFKSLYDDVKLFESGLNCTRDQRGIVTQVGWAWRSFDRVTIAKDAVV